MDALSSIRALFSHSCPSFFSGTNGARMGMNEKRTLKIGDRRSIDSVASNHGPRYGLPVAANSATGCRNPLRHWRTGAPSRLQALFLCPLSSVMAAVCGQASAWPGSNFPGIPTTRTAATQSRRKDRGSSILKLEFTMTATVTSKIRALAHRRMALSALRANSSLSVRLKRYNHHMAQARNLECLGGVQ